MNSSVHLRTKPAWRETKRCLLRHCGAPGGVFSFSHFRRVVALGTYGRPGVLLNPELLSEHEGDANARGVVFGRFRESWVVEQNLQTQEIGRWPEDNSRAWRNAKALGRAWKS